MKDKYNLTREQNVFLAKKVMTSSVYNAAKLEGLNTTYVQTEKILNGINDGNVSLDDVRVILNLKSAWKYILDNLDKDLDVDFICNVNKRVSANESLDWGVIRYGKVGVRLCDGKRFEPEIPRIEEVEKKLSEIKKIESTTERALNYYLWAIRSQLFWDGNKRTSNIVANAILISNGKGILNIEEKDLEEYNIKLSEYYLSGNNRKMLKFLYDNAIEGIHIDKKIEMLNPTEKDGKKIISTIFSKDRYIAEVDSEIINRIYEKIVKNKNKEKRKLFEITKKISNSNNSEYINEMPSGADLSNTCKELKNIAFNMNSFENEKIVINDLVINEAFGDEDEDEEE